MHRPTFTLLALALLAAGSARAQTLVRAHVSEFPDAPSDTSGIGIAVTRVADLDGDGVEDYAIGARGSLHGTDPTHVQGSVTVFSGAAGGVLRRIPGPPAGRTFGHALDALDDVDGDGYADLLVGAPGDDVLYGSPPKPPGQAFVVSGLDGAVLHVLDNGAVGGLLGWSVAALGDVDQDGVRDALVAAPLAQPGGWVGVFSGASGGLVYELLGAPATGFGRTIAALDDLDGDGVDDFAVGAPTESVGGNPTSGAVHVLSGTDGSPIHTLAGPAANMRLGGEFVARTGDVDGDGLDDLAAGAESLTGPWEGAVFSTASWAVLYPFTGVRTYDVAAVSDVDGDGIDDLVAHQFGNPVSKVRTLSGADGSILQTLSPPGGWPHFPSRVAGIGDLDGNGSLEAVVGVPANTSTKPYFGGSAFVFSLTDATPPGVVGCPGDGSLAACPCPDDVIFQEDFGGGSIPPGWSTLGLWDVSSGCLDCTPGDPHAYFGSPATCTYYTASAANKLISPPIALPAGPGVLRLEFCNSIDMDGEGHRAWVLVRGSSGRLLSFYAGLSNGIYVPAQWPPYDLTPLAGDTVVIEWRFTIDTIIFPDQGWSVDDVVVRRSPPTDHEGCTTSSGDGATLGAFGTTRLGADDLVLRVEQMPAGQLGILYVGTGLLPNPVAVGAGLACVGGGLSFRYAAAPTGPFGTFTLDQPFAKAPPGLFAAGGTYRFQGWFRDSGSNAPCAASSNLSNSYVIQVTP